MAASTYLARIVPVGDPAQQIFNVTAIDTSLYPDIGLPVPQPPFPGQPPYPSHPIAGGPWPTHPIFWPPGTRPPWAGGGPGGGGGGGGGGPVDPDYSPPWAQIPVDPGYSPPWATPGPRPTPGPGVSARVIPLPPQDPPVEPPEGMPADSTQVMIYFGPGTLPAMAWVAPYASTGPVEPPSGGAPAK